MKYILDTNIFVNALRITYPMDHFPSYWSYLLELFENETIYLSDEVKREIFKIEDELKDWIVDNKEKITIISSSSNLDIIAFNTKIMNYIQSNPQYKPAAKLDFASAADSWIIAQDFCLGYTVVTNEKSSKDSQKKIYIPDICSEFGVRCISSTQFIIEAYFRI